MKTTIYYFTATGNSLYIAKKLNSYIPHSTLVPIASVVKCAKIKPDSQKIGFVFPLYYWGVPEIVKRFLQKLDTASTTYIFYVLSAGSNDSNDSVTASISKRLKAKGSLLNAGFKINMPGNYIAMSNLDSPQLQKLKHQQAEVLISSVASQINANDFIYKKDRNRFISGIMNNFWQANVSSVDKKLRVNRYCSGCGLCAKVCPVDNIMLESKTPEWMHHCQECLACVHHCPQQAIEVRKRNTLQTGQYSHPKISVSDIIKQKNFFE